MNRLGRLAQIVGLNAVPIAGLVWVGWSDGTALALYWCETFVAMFLVALRMRIHRKLTNKRGHFRGPNSYFSGPFLYIGLLLMILPMMFVAVAVQHVDLRALRMGLMYSIAFLLVGFLLDLTTIRNQPFMWIRKMANFTWWRAILIDLAGLIGAFGVGFNYPRTGVIAFIALKFYTDLAANWRDYDPRDAPRFLRWFTKDTQELKVEWAAEYDERHQIYLEDEEPYDGRPSRDITFDMRNASERAEARRRHSRRHPDQ